MKLVRDRIPELILANGEIPIVRHVTGKRLVTMLQLKVLEEAVELSQARNNTEITEELADVMEAVDALWRAVGRQQVDRVRIKKQRERGAFAEGVVLLGTKPLVKKKGKRR